MRALLLAHLFMKDKHEVIIKRQFFMEKNAILISNGILWLTSLDFLSQKYFFRKLSTRTHLVKFTLFTTKESNGKRTLNDIWMQFAPLCSRLWKKWLKNWLNICILSIAANRIWMASSRGSTQDSPESPFTACGNEKRCIFFASSVFSRSQTDHFVS